MKIIAALDGSEHSASTLNFLLSHRWPEGTWIKVVHVVPCETGVMKYVMHALGKDNDCSTENVHHILTGVAEELAQKLNVSASAEVLIGDPVEAILSFADTFHPNLIVTGCRKKSAVDALLLGSVSQKLLEKSPCPIAIVRGVNLPLPPDTGSKILLAVDDSSYSAAAVEWLKWQTWVKNSHVALLSVTHPLHEPLLGESVRAASTHLLSYQAEIMLIESLLDKWAAHLQAGGNAREITRGTVEGSPSETILKGAHNWKANLIVMGAHGKTGIAKLVLGSVSQHISTHADCSVLIVKGVEAVHYEETRQTILNSMVLDDIVEEERRPDRGGPPSGNMAHSNSHIPPTGLY